MFVALLEMRALSFSESRPRSRETLLRRSKVQGALRSFPASYRRAQGRYGLKLIPLNSYDGKAFSVGAITEVVGLFSLLTICKVFISSLIKGHFEEI